MAIFYSDKAKGVTPAASAAAGAPQGTTPAVTADGANDVVAVEAKVSLTTALATNDTAVMCLLPAQHVPVDLLAVFDDIDDGAAVTATACVLDDTLAAAVASTDFFTAATTGQAGGVARASVAGGLRLASSDLDRWIGIIFPAGPGTGKAGTVSVTFTYRAANGD